MQLQANNLRIEVTSLVQERPALYNVRVRWSSASVADPNGLFNLRFRQWDSTWQTNDIWFDSPENSYETYTYGTEMGTGNALRNGDPPAVGKKNRFHAFLWNDGIVDTTNIAVTYYLISP